MTGPQDDREPAITPEEIDELRELGYSQSDIARMVDRTRQDISYIKLNLGRIPRDDYYKTPRETALESFPWKRVGKPFNTTSLALRLADHAEYQATDGEGMKEYKLRRLRSFYDKLRSENLVVEFHPDNPPTDYNKHGGYVYRPRLPSDGDLIIRVNDIAVMTPTARVVWRFPRRLPGEE